jgi:hypothetical protein
MTALLRHDDPAGAENAALILLARLLIEFFGASQNLLDPGEGVGAALYYVR